MSNALYFAASLPSLFFGSPPPFSLADFLFRCQGVLSSTERAHLDAVLAGAPGPGDFAAAWHARETQLRNATAHARAAAWGGDARALDRMHPGFDLSVQKAVTDAFAKPNPLEREQELDRCRWRVAADLARTAPLGLPGVLAFALHLRIAERWAGLEEARGRAVLEDQVSAGTAPAETPDSKASNG